MTSDSSATRPIVLASRALHLVVEVRILEVSQVEGRRVAHEAHRHLVGEKVAEQAFEQAGEAAEDVRRQRDPQLEQHQADQQAPSPAPGSRCWRLRYRRSVCRPTAWPRA